MDLSCLKIILESSPITVVSTLLVLILGILYLALGNRGQMPGPRGLPYLGYYPFLKDDTVHIQLQELMKKYGDVYSFRVTGKLYIHLGSIKVLKEAHVTKGDCFIERTNDFNVLHLLFGEGVIALNGEKWQVIRKFFVRSFREFGLTSVKDYMAGPIYDTMNATINHLKAAKGKPVDVISILTDQSCAIVRRMMFSDDGISEEELKGILQVYLKLFGIIIGKRSLLSGEFARRVILPRMPEYKDAVEAHKTITEILMKVVKKHKETFNEDSIRDVVDSYLKERVERQRKKDPSFEYFTDSSLVSSLLQIVGDGTGGVATFTIFFLSALLEYPEEQEKIYKELEEVVGPDRLPTLEDKNKLTYTNAFIQEVLRTTNFFPIFVSLECTKATTLSGYKVPVGSVTVMNMYACNRDPNCFENPDEFRPSRYIAEPGKQKAELPILFGVGRRSCAGEAFTMLQVFLFVTTIVKSFRLIRPKNFSANPWFDGNMEIILQPRKQDSS